MLCRLRLLAISAGLLFGVDLASIGAALKGLEKDLDLDDGLAEWVVSGAKGGAVFGSLVGGALIESRGRRTSIMVAALPFLVGPLLVFSSTSFWQAFLGRLGMGFGFGLASVATPAYLSEVVEPERRGAFEAMYEVGIASGMLMSALVNLALQAMSVDGRYGNLGCWRFQAGLVPCGFAVPLLALSFMVPESPRWLLEEKSSEYQLMVSLQEIARLGRPGAMTRIRSIRSNRGEDFGSLDEEDIEEEIEGDEPKEETSDDLIRLWDEKHRAAGSPLFKQPTGKDIEDEKMRTCWLLLRTLLDAKDIMLGRVPRARKGLLLALGAAILNQACASTSILIYAQHMLSSVGVGSEAAQDAQTVLLIFAKLVGVILGLLLVERVSRRQLLAGGGAACAVTLALLTLGADLNSNPLLMIGMGCFVLFFFSTWGVGYWAVVVEVTAVGGPRYASAAQAMATATLFGAGWLTSLTFIQVTSVGALGLLVYVGVSVLMFFYGACWLPEMRGHSLEQCAHDLDDEALSSDSDESWTS